MDNRRSTGPHLSSFTLTHSPRTTADSINSANHNDEVSSKRTPAAVLVPPLLAPLAPLSPSPSSSPYWPKVDKMAASVAATQTVSYASGLTMSKSTTSGGMDQLSFDLPPMPVSYEDFHFTLDLPDNLQASDLSLLETSNFETLFDSSGGSMTPSLVSSSAQFGTATLAVQKPVALRLSDSIMTSMPSSGDSTNLSLATASDPSTASSSQRTPTNAPPPPLDFQPLTESIFSFDSLFADSTPQKSVSSPLNNHCMATMTIPSSSSALPLSQRQPLSGQQSLFDSIETDFLSNFLEDFEASWNFNPVLPKGMPSFAAAAAQHTARGAMNGGGSQYAGSEDKITNSSGSVATVTSPTAGSSASDGLGRRAKGNKRADSRNHDRPTPLCVADQTTSMRAAFGGHLDEAEKNDQGLGGIASKRRICGRSGSGIIGHEKRTASLAQTALGGINVPGDSVAGQLFGPFQQHHYLLHGHQNQNFAPQQYANSIQMPCQTTNSFGMPQQQQRQHLQHLQHDQQQKQTLPSGRNDGGGSPSHSRNSSSGGTGAAAAKRELLNENEKRQNHILSEQRRRNHIREGLAELVALLDLGRLYGARGLGLSSGSGTGIEDEGLDDRTEVSSGEESDPEAVALAKARRKKAKSKRAAALNVAAAGATPGGGANAASRSKGKGRGRGGSAGGGAGSKSAVLFQAVDLIKWLEVCNASLEDECKVLEEAAGCGSEPATTAMAAAAAAMTVPPPSPAAKMLDDQDQSLETAILA